MPKRGKELVLNANGLSKIDNVLFENSLFHMRKIGVLQVQ